MPRTAGDLIVDSLSRYLGSDLPQQVAPWWWPLNDGLTVEDWGLTPARMDELGAPPAAMLSRLRGPNPTAGNGVAGFLGSVGSTEQSCDVVLLSTRPSQDSFPSPTTSKLVNRLADSGLTPRTHTTNLIKFRGHAHPGDDLMAMPAVPARVGKRLLRASVSCFASEMKLLQPRCILVAGGGTRDTLDRMSDPSFPSWHVIRDTLDRIPQVHVRSWVASVDAGELAAEWAAAAAPYLD